MMVFLSGSHHIYSYYFIIVQPYEEASVYTVVKINKHLLPVCHHFLSKPRLTYETRNLDRISNSKREAQQICFLFVILSFKHVMHN